MSPEPSQSSGVLLESEEHAEFLRLLEASRAEREELLAEAARRGERHAERLRELLVEVEGDLERLEVERRDPDLGRTIAGWRLERLIGRGASSRVYRVRREADGVVAALKLFDRSTASRRVGRELDSLRRLDHPAIVRLLDDGSDPTSGAAFAVTELVPDAQPVTEWALAHARTVDERIALVHSLRVALAAGHAAGIVHCDVSPANVLVAGDGRLKLVDFGLARLSDPGLTVTQAAAAGTPVCMAPEQVDPAFGPIGPWTDEYAAAVLSYRLLTGAAPYEVGPTLVTAAQAIAHVVPRPVREREPAVPAEVARWVDAGLVKRVGRRRRSLASVAAGPRSRSGWINVAALVAAILAAAFVARWMGESRGAVPVAEGMDAGEPALNTEKTMNGIVSAATVGLAVVGGAMAQGGGVISPEFSLSLPGAQVVSADIWGDLAVFGDLAFAGGGGARVLMRGDSGWTAGPVLTPPGGRVAFGRGVQVSQDWVIVGDPNLNNLRGVVHVWRRTGNNLTFAQTLSASDGGSGDALGWTICLHGSELFVNARLDDSWRGSIYRYSLNASGVWEQRQKIQSPNTNTSDEFGWEISAHGNYMLASAWLSECGYGSPSGSFHVYKRAGDGNYSQVFWAGDGLPGCTGFAFTSAMWGERACVAAPQAAPPRLTIFSPSSSGSDWVFSGQLNDVTAVIDAVDNRAVVVNSMGAYRVLFGTPEAIVHSMVLSFPAGVSGLDLYGGMDQRRIAGPANTAVIIWDVGADCDSDGLPDPVEIAQGAPDVNANGIPDTCECLADVDESGAVNAVDLAAILGVWGTSGGKYPRADIDGNGVVNAQDLAAVLGGWGPCL